MAIDSVIMSLVGVVIGAGITTGLAYVLAVRRENAERSNWRRDQCLTAYTDVLNACATIHFEAMATYMADANTEEHLAQKKCMTISRASTSISTHKRPLELFRMTQNMARLSGSSNLTRLPTHVPFCFTQLRYWRTCLTAPYSCGLTLRAIWRCVGISIRGATKSKSLRLRCFEKWSSRTGDQIFWPYPKCINAHMYVASKLGLSS